MKKLIYLRNYEKKTIETSCGWLVETQYFYEFKRDKKQKKNVVSYSHEKNRRNPRKKKFFLSRWLIKPIRILFI